MRAAPAIRSAPYGADERPQKPGYDPEAGDRCWLLGQARRSSEEAHAVVSSRTKRAWKGAAVERAGKCGIRESSLISFSFNHCQTNIP